MAHTTTTLGSVSGPMDGPLSAEQLSRIHAWWRAANYLSVGQIYLMANPLLREPLRPAEGRDLDGLTPHAGARAARRRSR